MWKPLVFAGMGVGVICFIVYGIHFMNYSPSSAPASPVVNTGATATQTARPTATQTPKTADASNVTINVQPVQPPRSPDAISITSFGTTHAALKWSGGLNATEYAVYRATQPNFAKARLVARVQGSTYQDAGLTPGITYFYWVAAENGSGTAQPTTYAKVTTYDSWAQIESQYANSVVKITTYTTALGVFGNGVSGTGWIAPGGYIVTNWHVVHDWNWVIDVYDQAGNKYHAKIVKLDKSHDLALLQFIGQAPTLPALPIGGTVQVGQAIGIFGHPGGEALTLTTGTVTETGVSETVTVPDSPDLQLSNMVQTDAGSVGGNSGSPVFNQWGKVVGIEESGSSTDGNVNYFVPVQYLQQWGIQ